MASNWFILICGFSLGFGVGTTAVIAVTTAITARQAMLLSGHPGKDKGGSVPQTPPANWN